MPVLFWEAELLNFLLSFHWMRTIKIAGLALLVIGSAVLTNTWRYRHDKNYFTRTLAEQGNEDAEHDEQFNLLQTITMEVAAAGAIGMFADSFCVDLLLGLVYFLTASLVSSRSE